MEYKVITNRINDVKGQIHTNLLNPTAKTQTDNGVTFTNNGDIQVWSVNLTEDTPMSTGEQAMLTLLLEKD